MTARWVGVDVVLAVAEQREDAAWMRLQHGHRVAAFVAKAAERRAVPAQECTWQATEPPTPRRPWAGLHDRELAADAARLVRLHGLRPAARQLGIDQTTLRRAIHRHGLPYQPRKVS